MDEQGEYFAAMLYPRVEPGTREAFLQRALVDHEGSVAGVPLACFETMVPETARFSRLRKSGPAALEEVRRRWASGAEAVLAHDRRMQAAAPSSEPLLTVGLDTIDSQLPRLSLVSPRALYRQSDVGAYFRDVIVEFGARYGCMSSGELRYVQSVTTLVPIGKPGAWREENADEVEQALESELLFYQLHRYELDERVPRAYWGNVLSPAHVAGLGGEERVRRESACFLVERWGENLYLQLTASPWEVTREQLLALNRYLEPIRFPGAPEPVYREGAS